MLAIAVDHAQCRMAGRALAPSALTDEPKPSSQSGMYRWQSLFPRILRYACKLNGPHGSFSICLPQNPLPTHALGPGGTDPLSGGAGGSDEGSGMRSSPGLPAGVPNHAEGGGRSFRYPVDCRWSMAARRAGSIPASRSLRSTATGMSGMTPRPSTMDPSAMTGAVMG